VTLDTIEEERNKRKEGIKILITRNTAITVTIMDLRIVGWTEFRRNTKRTFLLTPILETPKKIMHGM
jgi:hypothetical protein